MIQPENMNPSLGGQQADDLPPGGMLPVIQFEDDQGNKGAFLPVADPMSLNIALAESVSQIALKMALEPGLTPEPDAEDIALAKKDIDERIVKGLVSPNAVLVDPAFQIKYQLNVSNIVTMLVNLAAHAVASQYQHASKGKSRIVLPGR